MSKVYVGDVGTEIVVNCGVNISSATEMSIKARKPSGAMVTLSAVLSGQNYMKHVTTEGEMNEPGNWQLQAYVDMPTWRGLGETAILPVLPPFG
jgi:hypothetical protein